MQKPIDLQSIYELITNLGDEIAKVRQQQSHICDNKVPSSSSELKDLFTALAKAQLEMQTAGLRSENPYFKSRYADMAEIVRVSRPFLAKNGLSVIQQILPNDDGASILHTKLCHLSGQWLETRMRIVPAKTDIQSLASYITYLRRYSYAAIVGVVASDEDDDGEVAMVDSRDIIAKGPSIKYNPKERDSYETVSKDQLAELEYELAGHPDLAEEVLTKMRIQSLADLPKSKFRVSIDRIRELKLTGKIK
jgi:hypothetical protein